MARWTESRGYTLILTHPRGPDRYARVALVSKRTLFGPAFNVREARAEDASRSGREPEALGFGRMLSWRWLGQSEAEELLAARLRTLETLGYEVLGGQAEQRARGPWDWLRDLVSRQLEGDGAQVEERARDQAGRDGVAAQLRETLARLGLEADAVVEGLASILEIDEGELREPSLATLRGLEPELLGLLLPLWLDHDSEALREIGRRWLAVPTVLYEVEQEVLMGWAAGEDLVARALVGAIEREGLALVGAEGLGRLAHGAGLEAMKGAARGWHERLSA